MNYFHDDIGPSESDRSKGYFIVESNVWGKLLRLDYDRAPGVGFAFYYSTPARLAADDLLRQRPIVRDESTQAMFQAFGTISGGLVASFYPAPRDTRQNTVSEVREKIAVNS